MRISDWSSDVCSSDLPRVRGPRRGPEGRRRDRAGERAGARLPAGGDGGPGDAVRRPPPGRDRRRLPAGQRHEVLAGDRKTVVLGKRVSVRVEPGCLPIIKKKINIRKYSLLFKS